ncbi:MAG: response regulator, partial [Candidatus Omnitrophica bacterium]|nr:response regulator [Candidatus Omnitrophota bacterium]
DDEELIRRSLERLLSKEGYSLVIAKNGQEAIEKIKESDFDLIISDIRMPELDGIETIQHIRDYLKKSNKKLIPEILITGYADLEKYNKAMELKVKYYIYKPFDSFDFLSAVKRYIG